MPPTLVMDNPAQVADQRAKARTELLAQLHALAADGLKQAGLYGQRRDAWFLLSHLIAHPEAAMQAQQLLLPEAVRILQEDGYIDELDGQVLMLLKELVEDGFGTHCFAGGAWQQRGAAS